MADDDESAAPQTATTIEGRYSNYFEVGHNAFEFVLDFGQQFAGDGDAQIHTRIITAPSYAKVLMETLTESLSRYEAQFGQMPEPTAQPGTDDDV